MNVRRKLMFVLPRMGGGGAERVVSIIANHLCEQYDVTILVLVSNESFYSLDKRIRFISANYEVNRSNKVTRLISLARNFLNAIRFVHTKVNEIEPDIVFSLLEETDIVTYLALLGNERIIHLCSERNDPTQRSTILQKAINWIYQRCDYLVCQSQTVSDYYAKVSADKKIVIPNPVDFSSYPARVPEGDRLHIVAAGRLRPQKNFCLLIDSFARVAVQFPDAYLTIFGEGPQRELLEGQVNTLGLSERVKLPGASKQLLEDMRDASVFVMSSDFEGFPNALVEAIAIGIPVISTDFATGVAHEIIDDNVGIVVPCADKVAMSAALACLLGDEQKRKLIRENGYLSLARFDTEKVLLRWSDLINRVSNMA